MPDFSEKITPCFRAMVRRGEKFLPMRKASSATRIHPGWLGFWRDASCSRCFCSAPASADRSLPALYMAFMRASGCWPFSMFRLSDSGGLLLIRRIRLSIPVAGRRTADHLPARRSYHRPSPGFLSGGPAWLFCFAVLSVFCWDWACAGGNPFKRRRPLGSRLALLAGICGAPGAVDQPSTGTDRGGPISSS